jgi:predicted acyltransferase
MSNPSLVPEPANRLLSLDVLRGITIAFMIMVNNNGGEGSWRFMNHAAWNGLTPTDLVFPTFMFVMGASIVLSVNARLASGATRAQIAWHTLRRAGLLFFFGFLGNSFPFFHLEHLRVYGVLQRLGLCYLVVGLFYLYDRRVWTKVAALVAVLVGYWILVRWVPVPGYGLPGRDIPFLDPHVNIVNWLDEHMFPYHLYEDWTTHNLRDPEGLLSSIPAVGTVLLGLLTGLWLRAQKPAKTNIKTKTLGLLAGAVACLATGYLWSLSFPLNKKMWTSSYVLVAAGWSLAVFTLVYWVVEQWGWGKLRGKGFVCPWLVLGSNAIVAYMFSELLASTLGNISFSAHGHPTDVPAYVFSHVFANIPDPGWAAFAWSVFFLAVCFLPMGLLYRKKIFIKL